MKRHAERVERPTILEVVVSLTVLGIAAAFVVAVGWFVLTVWTSAIDYMQSAPLP